MIKSYPCQDQCGSWWGFWFLHPKICWGQPSKASIPKFCRTVQGFWCRLLFDEPPWTSHKCMFNFRFWQFPDEKKQLLLSQASSTIAEVSLSLCSDHCALPAAAFVDVTSVNHCVGAAQGPDSIETCVWTGSRQWPTSRLPGLLLLYYDTYIQLQLQWELSMVRPLWYHDIMIMCLSMFIP